MINVNCYICSDRVGVGKQLHIEAKTPNQKPEYSNIKHIIPAFYGKHMYIHFNNTASNETSRPNIYVRDIYADIIRLISAYYRMSPRVKL